MRVLLTVEETRTYKIVFEDMDSLDQAKSVFDPCQDLDGETPEDGSMKVVNATEVIDCPDCKGKGYLKPGYQNCPKCGGKGWIKPVIKLYQNLIEKSGLWHLFEKERATCICGKSSEGENHAEIPIEKRELCWDCHKDVHK